MRPLAYEAGGPLWPPPLAAAAVVVKMMKRGGRRRKSPARLLIASMFFIHEWGKRNEKDAFAHSPKRVSAVAPINCSYSIGRFVAWTPSWGSLLPTASANESLLGKEVLKKGSWGAFFKKNHLNVHLWSSTSQLTETFLSPSHSFLPL